MGEGFCGVGNDSVLDVNDFLQENGSGICRSLIGISKGSTPEEDSVLIGGSN